jgi:glucose uptake protein
MLVAMFCWGSWGNSIVLCGDRLRFELFYANYTIGVFAMSALAALTLGMLGGSDARFIPDDLSVSGAKIALAMVSGAICNLGNLLLLKGVQMCGLAVAFPIGVGTAQILGTLLTNALEGPSQTNTVQLFTGVAVAFVGVCTISQVHRLKNASRKLDVANVPSKMPEGGIDVEKQTQMPAAAAAERQDDAKPSATAAKPSNLHKLGVCLAGGVMLGSWAPFTAMAQVGFHADASDYSGFSPYGTFFFFSVGTFLSTVLLLPLVLKCPLDGSRSVPFRPLLQEYTQAPRIAHVYGLLGGLVWAAGTLLFSISALKLSFAASYAIGECNGMVGLLWGVVVFREFKGTSLLVKALVLLVVVLYATAIALISTSHEA